MSKYGIVETNSNGQIQRILEKPSPDSTDSRQAVAGRYGLSERMMAFLAESIESLQDEPGEIGITPILNLAIRNDFEAIALPTVNGEVRYDCGSKDGYQAAIEAVS